MASDYLNFGGWTTLPRPPFNCLGADFYGFSFPAHRAACQQYLDKSYNAIAGRQKYRVYCWISCSCYTSRILRSSRKPRLFPTKEAFLKPTPAFGCSWGATMSSPSFLPRSHGFRHICSSTALSPCRLGARSWAIPNISLNMTSPDNAPSAGPFTASAMLTRTFAPDAIASQHEFLSAAGEQFRRRAVGEFRGDRGFPSRNFRQTGRGSERGPYCGPSSRARTEANSCSIRISPFPSGTSGNSARPTARTPPSTRPLVEGPLTLTTVRQACLLPGVWTLELGVFDSLPFVTELGLGEPKDGKVTLTTNLGFYANCDYISGTASPHRLSRLLAASPEPAQPSTEGGEENRRPRDFGLVRRRRRSPSRRRSA